MHSWLRNHDSTDGYQVFWFLSTEPSNLSSAMQSFETVSSRWPQSAEMCCLKIQACFPNAAF